MLRIVEKIPETQGFRDELISFAKDYLLEN